jgi:hypothetical protein
VIGEWLLRFDVVLAGNPFSWLVLGLGSLAIVQAAVGLGRSRQWTLLPLALGWTALAGFLLNPLADASSSHQLRAALGNHDVLTSLAIVQMVLAAMAIAFSLRLVDGPRCGWWAFGLGVVHTLPAPMLVVAMLFWQQAWLEQAIGARPEAVGRYVGLTCALLLTVGAAVAMAVPVRCLAAAHLFFSGMVVLACMFVPLLPLPLPGMQLVIEPLDGTHRVTLILAGVTAAAFFLWGLRCGPSFARRRPNPLILLGSWKRAESELS